ncbi:MAG TPA: anti-sigma factor [Chitinophagaceae bacterium]|nr:anti-sigma factor [Chitinophagaceae bacterium]
MNIKEYIESGILEQYVMGTVTAQERQEVECMSHIYPEIATELHSVQEAMEAFAISMKKTPPADLKNKILASLHELAINESESNVNQAPQLTVTTNKEDISNQSFDHSSKSNMVAMPSNLFKIAASILLLLSVGLGYMLYDKNRNLETQKENITKIKNDLELKERTIAFQSNQLSVIQNPNFTKVALAGVPTKSPESKVTIYWNKQSQDVYLSVQNLPVPSEDKQYQLWAIADGKPVDMGMLSNENMDSLFQKMKTIGNAQAFAITLEKKGGVPSPTMTEMYVVGGV